MLKINYDTIHTVNLQGRGGKEQLIRSIFTNNLRRESSSLYDLVDDDTQIRYEFKKQKDLQWLDPSKYYNLLPEDRNIIMVFVCYTLTGIDLVFTCTLGELVDIEYTPEILKACFDVREVDATVQTKKGLKTRKFFEDNQSFCKVLYNI